MIIYASRLTLTNDDARSRIGEAIDAWLEQLRRSPGTSICDCDGRVDLGSDHFIEVARHDDESRAFAFRYGHPDRATKGREWLTEIGVTGAGPVTHCSILLQTRELAAQIRWRTDTTRPRVVQHITERCALSSATPGGALRQLTESDCEAFDWTVHDPDRLHPIVQVSALADGGYLVDADRLNDLLAGIADVVVIPADADTFAISDALGSQFSAYHGAINVLWPTVERFGESFVPSTRLLATHLQDTIAKGGRPESDVLALVCQRTNAPIARQHVSIESVQSRALRSALQAAQAATGAESAELKQLYKDVDEDQREQITSLTERLANEEREHNAARSRIEELEATTTSLKSQLERAGATSSPAPQALSSDDRAIIAKAMLDDAKLDDCLRALVVLHPDRVVVLESAFASAKKARKFNAPRKAFDLLSRLCGDYYDALCNGEGTQAGRAIFGAKSFAPKESETVENNKRATSLRTFEYRGKSLPMMAHLKIGIKDSVTETFRCHFHWDSAAQRIIIGHCGKHLDHK